MKSTIFAQAAERYHECRGAFADHLDALYDQAEAATNGVLLNARGKRAGIDAYTLLYGPEVRLRAYGSEELIDFLATRGRMTYHEFERQWAAA